MLTLAALIACVALFGIASARVEPANHPVRHLPKRHGSDVFDDVHDTLNSLGGQHDHVR